VPVTSIVAGGASLKILTVAERSPTSNGANEIEMVQPGPFTSIGLTMQLLVWIKSAAFVPVIEIEDIFSGALPELVSVTVWAIEVDPVLRVEKLSMEDDGDTAGTPPVPNRYVESISPVTTSCTVKVPGTDPVTVGAKVTPT
jgi:hypothetical protein